MTPTSETSDRPDPPARPAEHPTQHGRETVDWANFPEVAAAVEDLPQIAGYTVLRVLGRGGMGVVYKAQQIRANRIVALKMVLGGEHARSQELARFQTEAHAVAKLQHPHIVQIYEVGEHNGMPYFSLEFCPGGALAQKLDGTPWPGKDAARLVEKLSRAMTAAHQNQIIHRDLKPGNILLGADGEPRVTDFGLAKQLDQRADHTQSGAVMGTPSYMSPEQATGNVREIGPPSDVYALGAILYELLTGRPPFRGPTNLDTLWQVISVEPVAPSQLNPKTPRDLETICLKCLQKTPEQRYGSSADLAEDLRRFLAEEPISARPVTVFERGWRWCRRNRASALAMGLGTFAALAIVVLLFGGAFLWEQSTAAELLRREQSQTKEALGEARRQRQVADRQRTFAEEQQTLAMKYRRQAERLSADIALDRGVALCEDGTVAQGVLWLAQGLQGLSDSDPETERAVRVRLSVWRHQVHPLQVRWQLPEMSCQPSFSRDSKIVVTGHWDRTARLWETATGQLVGEPLTLPAEISLVALSPSGATAVICCRDNKARLWDVKTGKLVGEPLVHGAAIFRVQFSADSQKVFTCSKDYQARLWDIKDGKPAGPPLKTKPAGYEPFFLSELSADGRLALTTHRAHNNDADIWDTIKGERLGSTTVPHQDRIVAMAFNSGGTLVATGSWDQTVQVWEIPSGKLVGSSLVHQGSVSSVAFCPDGRLATASADNRVQFWDTAKSKPQGSPMVHKSGVLSIVFAPDNKTCLTICSDQTVRLWETATGQPIGAAMEHRNTISHAGFDADSQKIVTYSDNNLVNVWQRASAELPSIVLKHGAQVFVGDFSPDSQSAVTGGGDFKAKMWRVADGQPIGEPMQHKAVVRSLAFSSSNGLLATSASHSGEAQLWDASTTMAKGPVFITKASVDCSKFSPNGQFVMTGSTDGIARIWKTATGELHGLPLKHPAGPMPMEFSPDNRLALTFAGNAAYLWDVETCQPHGPPLMHQGLVMRATFSPDGQSILTCGMDSTARLWSTATGQPLRKPFNHPSPVMWCVFSPDGRTAWTASDHGAARWDAKSGKSLGPPLWLPNHKLRFLTISPDGRTLLTAAWTGAYYLWETATGRPLGPPLPHFNRTLVTNGNRLAAISPDNRTALTSSTDGTARLWKLPLPIEGDPERLRLWTQVLTGLDIDDDGTVKTMSAEGWEKCRRRLAARGGPPS